MGKRGLAAFLSEPRFEGLPATLETPGPEKKGSDKKEVTLAKRLRREGLKRRASSASESSAAEAVRARSRLVSHRALQTTTAPVRRHRIRAGDKGRTSRPLLSRRKFAI